MTFHIRDAEQMFGVILAPRPQLRGPLARERHRFDDRN